eukprot:1161594-Pelagomonas_calceolata.AAC.6
MPPLSAILLRTDKSIISAQQVAEWTQRHHMQHGTFLKTKVLAVQGNLLTETCSPAADALLHSQKEKKNYTCHYAMRIKNETAKQFHHHPTLIHVMQDVHIPSVRRLRSCDARRRALVRSRASKGHGNGGGPAVVARSTALTQATAKHWWQRQEPKWSRFVIGMRHEWTETLEIGTGCMQWLSHCLYAACTGSRPDTLHVLHLLKTARVAEGWCRGVRDPLVQLHQSKASTLGFFPDLQSTWCRWIPRALDACMGTVGLA